MAWVLILLPLLISCVTLNCLFNLFGLSSIISKVEMLIAVTSERCEPHMSCLLRFLEA